MEIAKDIHEEITIKNAILFQTIDKMIKENLNVKSIKEMQDELIDEISINRGKYKDNWPPALKFGEKGQDIFKKFLVEKRGYTFMSDCKDITSDQTFLKNGKHDVFELKTDSRHLFLTDNGELRDTKNILIEYSSRGKDSGIYATKAEFFVTYFPQINELWLIKTEKLKRLLKEAKYDFIDKKNIGDKGSETHGFLTKREAIKSEFSVVHMCEEDIATA